MDAGKDPVKPIKGRKYAGVEKIFSCMRPKNFRGGTCMHRLKPKFIGKTNHYTQNSKK